MRLARRGLVEGDDHRLVLFDKPFRSGELDFDPGIIPTTFIRRGPGLDLRFSRVIAHHFREAHVKVVHAHNDTALFYASLAAHHRVGYRSKLVATFHSWPTYPTAGARFLARWSSSKGTIVAVSDELRDRLVAQRWVKRCRTIVNGVDLEQFSPSGTKDKLKEALGVSAGSVLVGHVGRFEKVKRQVDLVEAATLLELRAPEVAINFVGQGPLQSCMRELARKRANVRFIDQIVPMAPFMRALDVLVLCSEDEGTPLVLLEAMACGCAIVATAVGGIPSVVGSNDQNSCAILIPPARPDLLASAIERVAREPALRRGLADNATKRAQHYSFEYEWRSYNAIYSPDASV